MSIGPLSVHSVYNNNCVCVCVGACERLYGGNSFELATLSKHSRSLKHSPYTMQTESNTIQLHRTLDKLCQWKINVWLSLLLDAADKYNMRLAGFWMVYFTIYIDDLVRANSCKCFESVQHRNEFDFPLSLLHNSLSILMH